MSYVYLLQESKLIETNRFKVGYSSIDDDSRQKKYGKDRRVLKIFKSDEAYLIECVIKRRFKNMFRLVTGTETFEGDETKMIDEFEKICQHYNGIEYINPIIEENKNKIESYIFEKNNYQLTYYYKSDVLTQVKKGHDKNISEKEIIEIAIKNNNFIITKAGNDAQWYLKGNQDRIKKIPYYKNQLEHDGKKRDGLYTIVIEKLTN